MKCLSPLRLKQKPPVDAFGRQPKGYVFVDVPCGKCVACLSNRKRDWVFRLKEEFKRCTSAAFVTLTYAPEFLPMSENGFPTLTVDDCQKFMKRLRFNLNCKTIRYFLVGEYGSETLRPHYHALIFNFPVRTDVYEECTKAWKKGGVYVGSVSDASIEYVCKYILVGGVYGDIREEFKSYGVMLPFMRCSRRPAIGKCYLTDSSVAYHQDNDTLISVQDGRKILLPRYYRNKIFDGVSLERLNSESKACAEASESDRLAKYEKYGPLKAAQILYDEQCEILRKVSKQFKLNRNL